MLILNASDSVQLKNKSNGKIIPNRIFLMIWH